MPMYEFECEVDHEVIDRRFPIKDRPMAILCPNHPRKLARRILSTYTFHIKDRDW